MTRSGAFKCDGGGTAAPFFLGSPSAGSPPDLLRGSEVWALLTASRLSHADTTPVAATTVAALAATAVSDAALASAPAALCDATGPRWRSRSFAGSTGASCRVCSSTVGH
eukprot:5990177-Amphidinium_carterae.1